MDDLSQREWRRREGRRCYGRAAPRSQVIPWSPWHRALQESLPPTSSPKDRNAAITATYARWYREHPDIFKWAGMAAFASHRVELVLQAYSLIDVRDGVVHRVQGQKASAASDAGEDLHDDVDLILETNNLVFADVAWAHAALLDPDGGIAAVEAALRGRHRHTLLLRAFRQIAAGRALLDSAHRRAEAEAQIWSGNYLVLKHEQWVTVQRQFAKLSPRFRGFMNLTSSFDFDALHDRTDWRTYSYFYAFMLTCGAGALLCTRSLPDITDPRHRWLWISRSLFPTWKRLDGDTERVAEVMEILASRGDRRS